MAKVMGITFLLMTVVLVLNITGVFEIKDSIMVTVYACSAVLLLLPAILTYIVKWESRFLKYNNVACASVFVMLLCVTLTYHVVVIYVYPIAIASLYFSKKLNVFATVLTVVSVSLGQIAAYYMDTVKDDNFSDLYETIVWGIIPRAIILIAIAVIFTMLCQRTVALLRKNTEASRQLENYHSEMVMGFSTLVENKDGSTGGHIKRSTMYVELLAEELKRRGYYADVLTEEYVKNLCMAAPMHDIGKISVPDVILQKPGKLTDEEFAKMKEHAASGGKIVLETFGHLGNKDYTEIAYMVARHHHEKWNGRGYPDGLVRKEIPVCARIMAIADVFDAVSEKRCYRDAMPLEKCFSIIQEGSGQDFDPVMVEVFLDCRDKVEKIHREFNQ